MKTCKTCAHSKPDWTMWIVNQHWDYSLCHHPDHYSTNKVTGKVEYTPRYCSVERKFTSTPCGNLGKLWESRK